MTDEKTEKPVELKEEDLEKAQGAGIIASSLGRDKKAGIIVVDEDGAGGTSSQTASIRSEGLNNKYPEN